MRRARRRGHTLLEFAVVASVLAILAGVLLHKLHGYQRRIELLGVEQVLMAVRSELVLRAAHLIVSGRGQEVHTLAQENPLDWFSEKPGNYAGVFDAPKPGEVAPGNWYFDRADRALVYVRLNRENFVGWESQLLKFKVKVVNNSHNADRKNFDRHQGFAGLALVQIP